jgi:hypothetical protein
MSYTSRYAQKESNFTASRIDFFTDVGGTFGLYWNNVLLSTALTPVNPTTGTLTGVATLDTGAVTTFTTRGVSSANPVITYKTSVPVVGVPNTTIVRIPAYVITALTGSPTTVTFAGTLPTASQPGVSAVNFMVEIVNGGTKSTGIIAIQPNGSIQLGTLAGTAFTASFGLAQDVCCEFITVSV